MTESHDTDFNQEQLVAYLDGEVSDVQRVAIEHRLAEDEEYRNKLVDLQRTWRMLDRLTTAHADESFTKSTIAMVAVAERSGEQLAESPRRRGLWKWTLIAAAAVFGFAAIYVPAERRKRAELRDLPVVHNFEMYRYAEDIDFLRQLAEEDLFEEEEEDVL